MAVGDGNPASACNGLRITCEVPDIHIPTQAPFGEHWRRQEAESPFPRPMKQLHEKHHRQTQHSDTRALLCLVSLLLIVAPVQITKAVSHLVSGEAQWCRTPLDCCHVRRLPIGQLQPDGHCNCDSVKIHSCSISLDRLCVGISYWAAPVVIKKTRHHTCRVMVPAILKAR